MSTDTAEFPVVLGIKEIKKILPHRYPFLFVDRVIHLDLDNNEVKFF